MVPRTPTPAVVTPPCSWHGRTGSKMNGTRLRLLPSVLALLTRAPLATKKGTPPASTTLVVGGSVSELDPARRHSIGPFHWRDARPTHRDNGAARLAHICAGTRGVSGRGGRGDAPRVSPATSPVPTAPSGVSSPSALARPLAKDTAKKGGGGTFRQGTTVVSHRNRHRRQ